MPTSGCELGGEGKPAGAWVAVVGQPAVEVIDAMMISELLREGTGTGVGKKRGAGESVPMGDEELIGHKGC